MGQLERAPRPSTSYPQFRWDDAFLLEPKAQTECDKPLLRPVVQIAFETPSLRISGGDDPSP